MRVFTSAFAVLLCFSVALSAQTAECAGMPVMLHSETYNAPPYFGIYNIAVVDDDQDGYTLLNSMDIINGSLDGVDHNNFDAANTFLYRSENGAKSDIFSEKITGQIVNSTRYEATYYMRISVTSVGNSWGGACVQISPVKVKISSVELIDGDVSHEIEIPIYLCYGDNTNALTTTNKKTFADKGALEIFVKHKIVPADHTSGYTVKYYTNKIDLVNNDEITYANFEVFENTELYFSVENGDVGITRKPENMKIVFKPRPIISGDENITVCDNDSDGFSSFDLSGYEEKTKGEIAYYTSLSDANSGSGETVSSPYQNTVAYTNSEIWARITHGAGAYVCHQTQKINLKPGDTRPKALTDIVSCASGDNPNRGVFNLTDKDSDAIAGRSNITVTYHTTLGDAQSGMNRIGSASTYVFESSQNHNNKRIFARVADTEGCYGVSAFHISVATFPEIDLSPLEVCQAMGRPVGVFDINAKAEVIKRTLKSDIYALTITDGASVDLSNNTNYLAPNGKNLSVVITTTDGRNNTCTFKSKLPLVVHASPGLRDSGYYYSLCEDEEGMQTAVFDLESKKSEILGDTANTPVEREISYYETSEDMVDDNVIMSDKLSQYNTEGKTIYVKVSGKASDASMLCSGSTTLNLDVKNKSPDIITSDYTLCGIGSRKFDLVAKKQDILDVYPEFLESDIKFYASEDDAYAKTTSVDLSHLRDYDSPDADIFIEYTNGSGCSSVSSFSLVVTPELHLNEPSDLVLCTTATNDRPLFDLTSKERDITQSPGLSLYFYKSRRRAEERTEEGRIPPGNGSYRYKSDEAYPGKDGEIIYASVRDSDAPSCTSVVWFKLSVVNKPDILNVVDIVACDGNEEPVFNLNSKIAEITKNINSPIPDEAKYSYYKVSFHENIKDAGDNTTGDNPDNTIQNPDFYSSDAKPVFARVYDLNNGCSSVSTLSLSTSNTKILKTPPDNVVCEDLNHPRRGTAKFDLNESYGNMIATGVGSTGWSVTYYPGRQDAIAKTNPIVTPGSYRSSDATLTARIRTSGTCESLQDFDVVVRKSLIMGDIGSMQACETFDAATTAGTGTAVFNLRDKLDRIKMKIPNANSYHITIHAKESDANNAQNDISTKAKYSSPSTVMYMRSEYTSGPSCVVISPFRLILNPLPVADTPKDLTICEDISKPGTGVFDLTENTPIILGTTESDLYSVEYFTSEKNALQGQRSQAIPNPENYRVVIAEGSSSIYARAESLKTGCHVVREFHIAENYLTEVGVPDDLGLCNADASESVTFDLSSRNDQILAGLSNTNYNLIWYETEADADAGYPVIANTSDYKVGTDMTVFAKVIKALGDTDCPAVIPLNLKILNAPTLIANPFDLFQDCKITDGSTGGSVSFDLTKLVYRKKIAPDDYQTASFEFYETECEAKNETPTCTRDSGVVVDYPYTALNEKNIEITGSNTSKKIWVLATNGGVKCSVSGQINLQKSSVNAYISPTVDYVLCDDNSDWSSTASAEFELRSKDVEFLVTGGASGLRSGTHEATYYLNARDAQNGVNSLDKEHYRVATRTKIHVRVENTQTHCYNPMFPTFHLEVKGPVMKNDALLRACPATDGENTYTFDLSESSNMASTIADPNTKITIATALTHSSGNYTYSFVEAAGEMEARMATATISNINNYETESKTIYAKVTESVSNVPSGVCIGVAPLKIEVPTKPIVDTPSDIYYCDTPINDVAHFDLTSKEAGILGTQLGNFTVTYHVSQSDADSNVNLIPNAYSYSLASGVHTKTIFARVSDRGCYGTTSFSIGKIPPIQPVIPTANPTINCEGEFDLNAMKGEIMGRLSSADYTLAYYETREDAYNTRRPVVKNVLSVPDSGTFRKTLVARISHNNSQCYGTGVINLINKSYSKPLITPGAALEKCDDDHNGMQIFDLRDIQPSITDSYVGRTFEYYVSRPTVGVPAIAGPDRYTVLGALQNIFIKITDVNSDVCESIGNFQLIVNSIPTLVVNSTVINQCGDNVDDTSLFNLDRSHKYLIPYGNPENLQSSYYKTTANAKAGESPLKNPYHNKYNGEIVIGKYTDLNGCSNYADINLRVSKSGLDSSSKQIIEVCDDDDDSDDENGIATFDITSRETQLSSFIFPSDINYKFSYFYSLDDAIMDSYAITNTGSHTNIHSPLQEDLYVRIEDPRNGQCVALDNLLTLIVNPVPKVKLNAEGLYCINGDRDVEIGENLGLGYRYLWSTGERTPTIKPKTEGTYTVDVTSNKGCVYTSTPFDLKVSSFPTKIDILESYSFNNTTGRVSIEVEGGDFVYAIDDTKTYSDSTVFDGLDPGSHMLFVKDRNGCGVESRKIMLVGYPKVVTPNGDGINDEWTVYTTSKMIYPVVVVFDRKSNPLARFDPSKYKWNGNFAGVPLPSDDYWFSLKYIDKDDNLSKVFRGHFSLKR